MYYFYDESGNWSGRERFRLVMGGLHVQEQTDLNRLTMEFKLLKASHNLAYLHANEMSKAALEECFQIIASFLAGGARAYLRIFPPKILFESTRMSFEEIYIDRAASLVSTMILGDKEPQIFYDMKFHYAYPQNILSGIRQKKPYYYKRVMDAHAIKDSVLSAEKTRIEAKIKKVPKYELASYVQQLAQNEEQAVSDYLWSELILQVQGKEQARELFRAAILNNLKAYTAALNPTVELPSLNINYIAKNNNNAGVELIDILCNLVYGNGSKASQSATGAVRNIYQLMTIEENEE
ncbi:MAG: hypothetical protein M0Q16_06145 [Candidatus Cloacimonetes bacterium]|nr:hypothetical protein [Candidatus Cloacimonadota bacterium]MCK9184934.1 hypothetical protein [Candidatus Cloacimonadota bacterium]